MSMRADRALTAPSEASDRMPPAVRRAVLLAVALLLTGAGLVAAARGPAILIDLAAAAGRWLCL